MICIVHDLEGLSRRAAEFFVQQAEAALRSRGRFILALAGGHTPGAYL